jgi:hypothetical protein
LGDEKGDNIGMSFKLKHIKLLNIYRRIRSA